MKKETFYYDSRDGATRIHAIKWIPEEAPVCILQIVHGMAEYIDRYEPFAQRLASAGVLVTGNDHLGHGLSVGQKDGGPDLPYGYFCAHDPATVVVRDVHRLKKTVQEQYPGVPYLILGHSMGSFILRNYLCRYGTGIDAALIMGSGMQPKALVRLAKGLARLSILAGRGRKVAGLLDRLSFGGYNKRIPSPCTPFDWLSHDEGEVQKYMDDPLCGFPFTANGFLTLFELLNRLHDPESLRKMPPELPVFLLAGDEDPVGDYGEAVRRLAADFTALGMRHVDLQIYPGMRHELLHEREAQKVEADLLSWILARAGGAK